MLRATLLSTVTLLTLSGCGQLADIPLNPLDWFGSDEEAQVATEREARPLVDESRRTVVVDGRRLLDSIDSLTIDRTATGAIINATGTAATQGYYNAQLVNAGVSNGVLTLEFRAQAPTGTTTQNSARSRRITAAYVINAANLADIRTVRVEAVNNARTSAR